LILRLLRCLSSSSFLTRIKKLEGKTSHLPSNTQPPFNASATTLLRVCHHFPDTFYVFYTQIGCCQLPEHQPKLYFPYKPATFKPQTTSRICKLRTTHLSILRIVLSLTLLTSKFKICQRITLLLQTFPQPLQSNQLSRSLLQLPFLLLRQPLLHLNRLLPAPRTSASVPLSIL
jgi:hypothetical protein